MYMYIYIYIYDINLIMSYYMISRSGLRRPCPRRTSSRPWRAGACPW